MREAGCEVAHEAGLEGAALADALGKQNPRVLVVRSTRVQRDALEAGKELGLVIRAGSGFNTIDTAFAASKEIAVANCPGKNAEAVAELAVGLMLAMDRRIPDNVIALRKGVWDKKGFGKARGIKGRTLGIVGLGRIGSLVAVRGLAFEMKILYADVVRNERMEKEHGVRFVALVELLREADYVTLHVPLTGDTEHIINTESIATMKPTAGLINTSRGDVVDEAALVEALRSGKIACAALDVYENEPGAGDSRFEGPLAELENLYGTHHIGASTEQAQLAVAEETVRIVEKFQKTGEVLNRVN